MRVTRLGIDLDSQDPVIILTSPDKKRTLTIRIGPFEATAISIALDDTKFPRPLTHDLMKSVIEELNGKLVRVVIHNVVEDTFHAKLILTDSTGVTRELDARPSDGIALALRTKSPIYVTDFVFEHLPKRALPVLKPKESQLPSDPKKRKALALVQEGDRLGAAAFTSTSGAFEPFKDTSGGSHRRAVAKYNEAIKISPDLSQAYAARSAARYFLGEKLAAQQDARTALRLGHLRDRDLILLHAPFEGEESRQISRQCMRLAGSESAMYDHMWQDIATTYWYEGDFAKNVEELEAILAWQREHNRPDIETTLVSLGSGCEALGNLDRAEQAYKEAGEGDSLVRLYIHRERWADARAALQQYLRKFEADEKIVFAAGIDELEGKLAKVSAEQMAAAQKLGGNVNYYAFYLGMFQLRNGQLSQGRGTLLAFCEMCKSNPKEWGVTLAWECKRAEQILRIQ